MAKLLRGARARVDDGAAPTRTTAADIPASGGSATTSRRPKAVYPSATTENLTRRAPRIIGELVGPLLAQEAALAARTHLEWPYMSARKVPYTGRFICSAHPDMVNYRCLPP